MKFDAGAECEGEGREVFERRVHADFHDKFLTKI